MSAQNTQPRDYMLAASIGLGIAWALVQWWSIRTAHHAAGARLIAAAPDLFAALQELREAELLDDGEPRLEAARRQCDAAIAKATGAAA